MVEDRIELRPIGWVESQLREVELAPLHGEEGAPDAWLVLDDDVTDALRGLVPGQELVVLTWLHLAARDVLVVHPRGDATREQRGVFTTRSPSRPNPIGLHRVTVLETAGTRLRVAPLEAVDGTPILDLKPARPRSPDD